MKIIYENGLVIISPMNISYFGNKEMFETHPNGSWSMKKGYTRNDLTIQYYSTVPPKGDTSNN